MKTIIVEVEYRELAPHTYGFRGDLPEDVAGAVVKFRYEVSDQLWQEARDRAAGLRADMLDAGALRVDVEEHVLAQGRT